MIWVWWALSAVTLGTFAVAHQRFLKARARQGPGLTPREVRQLFADHPLQYYREMPRRFVAALRDLWTPLDDPATDRLRRITRAAFISGVLLVFSGPLWLILGSPNPGALAAGLPLPHLGGVGVPQGLTVVAALFSVYWALQWIRTKGQERTRPWRLACMLGATTGAIVAVLGVIWIVWQ